MIDVSDNNTYCKSNDCEAHRYMMEKLSDIKEQNDKRDAECVDIKTNVIILTQSHNRLGEILEELKENRKEQDRKIDKNTTVTNRVATYGSILVISIPVVLWMMENLTFVKQ